VKDSGNQRGPVGNRTFLLHSTIEKMLPAFSAKKRIQQIKLAIGITILQPKLGTHTHKEPETTTSTSQESNNTNFFFGFWICFVESSGVLASSITSSAFGLLMTWVSLYFRYHLITVVGLLRTGFICSGSY